MKKSLTYVYATKNTLKPPAMYCQSLVGSGIILVDFYSVVIHLFLVYSTFQLHHSGAKLVLHEPLL